MSTKFDLFLQQAQLNTFPLSTAKLNEVKVIEKKKILKFDITFDALMSSTQMSLFITQLQTFFQKPNVVNEIDYQFQFKTCELTSSCTEHFEALVHRGSEIFQPFAIFKNYSIEFKDNTYFILVDKDSKTIKKYLPALKKYFIKHGIDVEFELKLNEDLESVTDQVMQNIESQQEILESLVKTQDTIILDKKTTFQRKSSPSAVDIKEIPMSAYELDKYQNEKGDVNFLVEGEVFKTEFRELRNTNLLTISIFDETDAITIKRFVKTPKDIALAKEVKVGDIIQVSGNAQYDTFQKEVVLMARALYQIDRPKKQERIDKAKEKRVEFHLHTKASPMDAITSIGDYVETLEKWGHKAFAITDRNGLYAFPDLHKAIKGKKIKPIYGVQLDFVDDESFIVASDYHTDFLLKEATYTVIDIETTGLSNTRDKIIEIAAYKIRSGMISDRFEMLIDPEEKLSDITIRITNITDDMVHGQPKIEEVLPQFFEFIKDTVLVAHNASFDSGMLFEHAKKLNIKHEEFAVIDTLNIARYFYNATNKDKNHARYYVNDAGNIPDLKRFNLKAVTKFFKVNLEAHHRAIYDAYATAEVFIHMLQDFYKEDIFSYYELQTAIDPDEAWRHPIPKYANVLAMNQEGYKNLFKVVSDALTTHFDGGPRLLKSTFLKYRQGLLIGSGSENGEVFEMALNRNDDDLRKTIEFYDYIEVHPLNAYLHLEKDLGQLGREIIQATIKKIITVAKELNKIVIATSNAHYLNPEDKKYREIYIQTKSVGGGLHPLANYEVSPDQHLLTTNEMLESFSFLDEKLAYEIVVTNTQKLNEKFENVVAFPKELFSIPDDAFKDTLGIKSIADHVKLMVNEKATALYGNPMHPYVKARVDKELDKIIDNKFAPIYYISHLLVKKSLEDGYLVGSRGSVGSSLVATLMDITEVNPLRPHYRCESGDYSVFKMTEEEIYEIGFKEIDKPYIEHLKHVKSGYDLPDMNCPHCQKKLLKDGHDIPFETFLGIDGDKTPDIDLNFSGDYQAKAHDYVRELLGEDYTFRAGTIQTVAERNAYGYVKGYLEYLGKEARGAYIEKLAKGIEGVKRSTGQHPGGIIVVPKTKSIYDVTPIQYPADDINSLWKTTHFDYHAFEDNLLKLDILGHDDPTLIKFLMDYVKEHPNDFPFKRAQDIPLDDPKVYKLFQSPEVIGIKSDEVYGDIASYGIPEFGTPFTRQMLQDTRPNTFAGLVKISGLSHGTDVWLKNSQELILGNTQFGKISFDDIIGCRDDIMVGLSDLGMSESKAFEIMEFVRKGRPSSNPKKWAEYEAEMKASKIPDWYIWSASLIKYMFPKAHATAYVIMAMRIAWFKVYSPLLFYSGYFSKRAVQFEHDIMTAGYNAIRNRINQLRKEPNLTAKDQDVLVTLMIALEMTKRGFKFLPVHIKKSAASEFIMEKDGLRMPFVSIDGLGMQAAIGIVEARNEKPFTSKEDARKRGKLNKTVFEKLDIAGSFDDLNEVSSELEHGLFAYKY
ncbi:PolC-type DNA polymerase III [Acholeplasma granularum]|uniref:PolC-type DNA polymerase III n=1 Tax=Acholeplasma granularum TaxID=264635 RepID=UPI000470090A|nr:PolC-type DNA polymerase III [Acholeplasma granularum]